MPPGPRVRRYFQLARRDLVYFKFILEAYEGLTTLSTMEKEGVIVRVSHEQAASKEVDLLLQALGKEISLREVPPLSAAEGTDENAR